jgi:hypothetical protein
MLFIIVFFLHKISFFGQTSNLYIPQDSHHSHGGYHASKIKITIVFKSTIKNGILKYDVFLATRAAIANAGNVNGATTSMAETATIAHNLPSKRMSILG